MSKTHKIFTALAYVYILSKNIGRGEKKEKKKRKEVIYDVRYPVNIARLDSSIYCSHSTTKLCVLDPAMFPTSADASAFLVADIFTAMRAGGKIWQELDRISLKMGHLPLKKIYRSAP